MTPPGKRFLYEIVYLQLRNDILQGQYVQGSCLPSEREISLRFGVDRNTVRKALDILVEENLVEKRAGSCSKVLGQEQEKEPAPPENEKQKDAMIGFFVVEERKINRTITQPFYSDLFYEVEQQCKRNGINLLYATIKNLGEYAGLLPQLSGVIIAGKAPRDYFTLAEQRGVRALHINGHNGVSPSVFYDSFNAGVLMSEYLLEKGHRDIALITGGSSYLNTQNRLAGVLLTFFHHKLALRPEWVLEGNWEYESGYRLAAQLMQSDSHRPSAIYAFNDMMALGAMQSVKEMGLQIPADVSIAGGDNMRELKTTEEQLTTTDANIARMAVAAIQHFINTPDEATGLQVTVPVSLISGDTVLDVTPPHRPKKKRSSTILMRQDRRLPKIAK